MLVLTTLLVGCVSTQERFERGVKLENEGDYAGAARYYIEVLEKEDWPEARTRLDFSGARALEIYRADADASAEAGRFEEALGALHRLDDLHEDAARVGVRLPLPEDHAAYRERMTGSAIDEVIGRGEAAEADGQWREALSQYERVQERYALPPALHDDMNRARVRVYLKWAEEDLDRDYPRAAFGHAQAAIDLLGPDAVGLEPAFALQETALARGTRRVAFVPLWRLDGWMRAAPPTMLQDLNDVLTYDYWTVPPPFIASADPVQLRRELRRLRYDRTVLDRQQAAEIGRLFEADYVVTGEATVYERAERIRDEETEAARTRGRNALDTTYVVQEYELTLVGTLSYQIVDPGSRRVLDEDEVSLEVEDRFTRGVYNGRWTDLDLSSRERRLFEPDELAEAERTLEDRLVDELSALAAARVYDDLLGRIR